MGKCYPTYRLALEVSLQVSLSVLRARRRSFPPDARRLAQGIRTLRVTGNLPRLDSYPEGAVLTVNHYARPGFQAFWIPIAIAAHFPQDIHWVMTSTWTASDPLRARVISPLSRAFLTRLAHLYGFTSMPPMPPRPAELQDRAIAVTRIIRQARRTPRPVFGLAPEGMDSPDRRLQLPPPGVGRLMGYLASLGYSFIPVGIYEDGAELLLHFGQPYLLSKSIATAAKESDRAVACEVMQAISACLPPELRIDF